MREHRASSTALLIAASLSLLARTPRGDTIVPREARQLGDWLLRHYGTLTRCALLCLGQRWFHALVRGLEAMTVPDIVEHYAQRKRSIERLFREWGQARQLVVLGAGFDSLALRLATEFHGLQAIEIDHPATQAWKVRAVAACHLATPQLTFLPRDFSLPHELNPDFLESYHRKEDASFWVAEGFLMYFPVTQVEDFFRLIHRTAASGSRVAFTFMEPQSDGRTDFRRRSRSVRLWLANRKEPFAWGISREDLSLFLSRLGFRLLDVQPPITREMDRLNVGEYLAWAELC